jgi:tRNA threonylcarbamoyl adenosine modification protein (Sua5/YciO/YrdC/YwlC family)
MDVIEALRAGLPVLLPADGVYGLCALARSEAAVRGLYELKGRGSGQPTQVIAASVDVLLDAVPELPRALLEALLPGAYTLVLPNPARRFPWVNGERPETIGVRVARVPPGTQHILDHVGIVAATSANEPGEPAAATLAAVTERIRAGCGAELDAGELPGTPSTVVDYTGQQPRILREGAGPIEQALAAAQLR